jgi:hypothetical protein
VSATEWIAVGVVLGAVAVAAVLLTVLSSITKTLHSLAEVVEDLNREALPLLAELRGDAEKATAGLERVGDLVGAAESVTRRVDGASRLAYATFSNPVVKALAFGSGIGRAGRRLRGKERG